MQEIFRSRIRSSALQIPSENVTLKVLLCGGEKINSGQKNSRNKLEILQKASLFLDVRNYFYYRNAEDDTRL